VHNTEEPLDPKRVCFLRKAYNRQLKFVYADNDKIGFQSTDTWYHRTTYWSD